MKLDSYDLDLQITQIEVASVGGNNGEAPSWYASQSCSSGIAAGVVTC